MRLIDNYLDAVARYLPGKDRKDITAELKSSIYDQLEDQSSAMQRDLTESEQVEFLKKLGHPLKIAGEYAPQRYLIGPTLYPYYLRLLKTLAAVLCAFHIGLSLVVALASDDWGLSVGNIVSRILSSLLVMSAFVTLGFALMERSRYKLDWIENWNPLNLRKKEATLAVDRGDLVITSVAEFVLLLWWNGVIVLPSRISWGDAAIAISRSPAVEDLLWPVNVLLIGSMVLHIAMLWAGFWRRWSVILGLLLETGSAMVVISLLRANNLVSFESSGAVEFERVQIWLSMSLRVVLWFVLATIVHDLVKYGRQGVHLLRMGETSVLSDPGTQA